MTKGWNEMTIAQCEKVEAIGKDDGTELDKDVRVLSILSGIEEDKIWDMDITEVAALRNEMDWVHTPCEPVDFQGVDYQGMFKPNFGLERMSYRQYADLNSAMVMNDRAAVLAACLVPEDGEYATGYDMEDFTEWLRENVTMAQYQGFFVYWASSILSAIERLPLLSEVRKRILSTPRKPKTLWRGLKR